MERVTSSFRSDGRLFDAAKRTITDDDKILSPNQRIERWHDSFFGAAMKYNEGDTEKADYFLNCSVYEFYYRILQKINYYDWIEEQRKNK